MRREKEELAGVLKTDLDELFRQNDEAFSMKHFAILLAVCAYQELNFHLNGGFFFQFHLAK